MTKRTLTAILLTAAIALLVGIKVGGQAGSRTVTSSALPPASIPTFSTENIGRMAHFYVGGHYVGAPGKEYMDGAMYVELWVPKQVRQPYPIVMFHGNGQTGAVYTDDGENWATPLGQNVTIGKQSYNGTIDNQRAYLALAIARTHAARTQAQRPTAPDERRRRDRRRAFAHSPTRLREPELLSTQ